MGSFHSGECFLTHSISGSPPCSCLKITRGALVLSPLAKGSESPPDNSHSPQPHSKVGDDEVGEQESAFISPS